MLSIRAGRDCVRVGELLGLEQKRGGGSAKILKKKGQAGSRDDCLKGGLESPYETMMFTTTLLQDFFYLFLFIYYLFHIDHCYFTITF